MDDQNKSITSLTIELRQAKDILNQILTKFYAQTRYSSDAVPFRQQRFVLSLDRNDPTTGEPRGTISNPYKIGIPVTAIRCEDATDNSTEIKISMNGDSTQQLENYTVMKKNDTVNFDTPAKSLYLTWDAQAAKTITLIAYVDVHFESGTQVSSIAGGVNITTGSGMTPETPVSVSSTATLIASADSDRKNLTVGNPRTSGIDIWVSGTSAVTSEGGANPGVLLEPGDYFVYQGQGDFYGISASGTCSVSIQKEI